MMEVLRPQVSDTRPARKVPSANLGSCHQYSKIKASLLPREEDHLGQGGQVLVVTHQAPLTGHCANPEAVIENVVTALYTAVVLNNQDQVRMGEQAALPTFESLNACEPVTRSPHQKSVAGMRKGVRKMCARPGMEIRNTMAAFSSCHRPTGPTTATTWSTSPLIPPPPASPTLSEQNSHSCIFKSRCKICDFK